MVQFQQNSFILDQVLDVRNIYLKRISLAVSYSSMKLHYQNSDAAEAHEWGSLEPCFIFFLNLYVGLGR